MVKYSKELKEEIIKRSHERSMQYGVEKERIIPKRLSSHVEVEEALYKSRKLINVAKPFIENLYETVKGSGFFIVLTDKEGCILDIMGDYGVLSVAENLGMIKGAYMDERSIGTNAMGVTIKEDVPIQLSADEHYINAYHKWTCSAAAIHDNDNIIIGSLNLTGYSEEVHPHTLGMVVASVQSIEWQISKESIQEKLFEAYIYMNSILNSISDGIIAVDVNGYVKHLNDTANKMLDMHMDDVSHTEINHISKFIKAWDEIINRVKLRKKYMHEDVVINSKFRYSISANAIFDKEKNIVGVVLVIQEIEKVINLINKYSNKVSRYTFENMVYRSNKMRIIAEYAKSVACSPSTVLIQGESGSGKEVLAQSIHNASNRSEKPFIVINCGAIPKNLIESELFGYEEGAFTGAMKGGRAGKFELANGGTLFLDEIGEMPIDMQVNLLRVLQEGYVCRIGGSKYIPVDVRIIAATNRNLLEEIEKGGFREDLFYRLSVIPITIPPLRERREDLDVLIQHFLKAKAYKLNKPIPNINDETLRYMYNYEWRGNIRELENYIENIVNFDGKATFNIRRNKENQIEAFVTHGGKKENINEELICSLEEIEKKAINACLDKFEGNISKVAKTLGISRNTLYLKMKKYSIDVR